MYFIHVKTEDAVNDFTVKHEENYHLDIHTIQYYRNFYELHEFMCKLYHRKNNNEYVDHDDLNCSIIRVTPIDLDEMKKDIKNVNNLIEKIQEVWKSGDFVYYFPSW